MTFSVMPILLRLMLILLGMSLSLESLQAQEWTQFRGSGGQGVSLTATPPIEFSEYQNVRWKTPVPGLGWSSPVVIDEEIWLTTAVRNPARLEACDLYAVCLSRTTGEIRHAILLFSLNQPEAIHDDNSYASPTPVVDENRVYCHFGTFGTAAVQRSSGEVVWKNETLRIEHQGGPGSSPIGYRDWLIVSCDGADQQYVAALRKIDGTIAWKQNRSAPHRPDPITHRAFATPLLWERAEGDLLISPAADQVHAYRPETGEEVWHVRYLGFSNVPAPVTAGGQVFVCTGFFTPTLLAIRPEGQGDVTSSHVNWHFDRSVTTIPSPIVVEQKLYTVNEGGILTCLDCQTGKILRKRRMVGNYSASPIFASGLLYFCSEAGKITVIEPNKTLDIRQVNHLQGSIKASPAAVGNCLIVRTDSHVYCLEEK